MTRRSRTEQYLNFFPIRVVIATKEEFENLQQKRRNPISSEISDDMLKSVSAGNRINADRNRNHKAGIEKTESLTIRSKSAIICLFE